MFKVNQNKIIRLVDANYNRAKEALRVCEDICRFVLDQKPATKIFKTIRHRLTTAVSGFGLKTIVRARQVESDVGRRSVKSEFKRRDIADIFYANAQRAKESLRVLEEAAKLGNKRQAEALKRLRYQVYTVEKKIIAKL